MELNFQEELEPFIITIVKTSVTVVVELDRRNESIQPNSHKLMIVVDVRVVK